MSSNSEHKCSISSLCSEEIKENNLQMLDIDKKIVIVAKNKLKLNQRFKGEINKQIFYDVIPIDNFPDKIILNTIPKLFKNFFIITRKGILCIRPYSIKRGDIDLSSIKFDKDFSNVSNGYSLNYKTWDRIDECI